MSIPNVILRIGDKSCANWFRSYFSSRGYPVGVICPHVQQAVCSPDCPSQTDACLALIHQRNQPAAELPTSGHDQSQQSTLSLLLLDIEKVTEREIEDMCKRRRAHAVVILAIPPNLPFNKLVQFMDWGADDFLVKPFKPEEFEARFGLWIQRKSAGLEREGLPMVDRRRADRRSVSGCEQGYLQSNNAPGATFTIDDNKKVIILNGNEIALSRKEFSLISLLASAPGKVFSAEEVIAKIWRGESSATVNDLHQYIRLLRRRIEPNPSKPCWIITVKGFGYKFEIPKAEGFGSIKLTDDESLTAWHPSSLHLPN